MIRFCQKNYGLMFALVCLWAFQFILFPSHYHPETTHSHLEQVEDHQHSGRYHSATLEAYAHLVNGHSPDHELDDDFHHSHSSEENDEGDSSFFIPTKNFKSFKQGLTFKQVGHPTTRFEISNPLVSAPVDSKNTFLQSRFSGSPHSSRSPPALLI
ncbi:MAG: hypothetical protein HN907_08000 [Nitrospina sp.]|jgi:hypothetical protein|nr:hypothetical protein [Nitrospina sp.]MBT7179463.1 hypothetical protein [Nitrospina sp.]